MPASLPVRIKIADNLLAADLAAGDAVLLDIHGGTYFSLTPVAARLWQDWTLNGSVANSIDRLVENYKVDRPTAEADVAELIAELSRRKLITVVDSE